MALLDLLTQWYEVLSFFFGYEVLDVIAAYLCFLL